jgi:hypothetical protein
MAGLVDEKLGAGAIGADIKTKHNSLITALLTAFDIVAGVLTFGVFPVTPSSAPTTDYQVANKKYHDDDISAKFNISTGHDHDGSDSKILGYGGMSAIFYGWSSSKTINTTYTAATDIIVTGWIASANSDGYYEITSSSAPILIGHFHDGLGGLSKGATFCFPVKKGATWKLAATGYTHYSVMEMRIGS